MKSLNECTILVVDDTEANVDILIEVLGDVYEMLAATDGETAIRIAETERPDIILLDIMMPGISGYEVCARLKDHPVTAEIPVIFLTTMADTDYKTRGFELGAVDYITKPFDSLEVIARIHTHLSLKLARAELSVQNDILEKKVWDRTHELSLTQETTIEAIACLAEYRDSETGGHIKRTKNYVKIMAQRLSLMPKYQSVLTDYEIDMLYKSAPLHDIGKIGIRDEVLFKPGKLTDDEFNEMKQHPLIGFNALSMASLKLGKNSFLKYALEFTRCHQEKWDGTGYPDGLAGENIPLAARIMAIADTYDALISKRVYKPPYTHQSAVKVIANERGKQFDPELVDVFLELQEEFREVAAKFSDYNEESLTWQVDEVGKF